MGSILSWLDSIWNLFTGPVSQLWHWIIGAFKTIWSYVYRLGGALEHDIVMVSHSMTALARAIESWATTAIDNLYHLTLKWVTDLQHWTGSLINQVSKYSEAVYHWALSEVSNLIHAIENAYADIEHWVIAEIWDPLYRGISGALDWIAQEGAYVYDLLTHPDKLVTLIESYLWSSWLTWLKRLAIPVTAFIVQNFRAVVPDLVSVAEDVIDKVL